MAATTTTAASINARAGPGTGAEDRVLVTAQQIVICYLSSQSCRVPNHRRFSLLPHFQSFLFSPPPSKPPSSPALQTFSSQYSPLIDGAFSDQNPTFPWQIDGSASVSVEVDGFLCDSDVIKEPGSRKRKSEEEYKSALKEPNV